jgi:hypothetical protein
MVGAAVLSDIEGELPTQTAFFCVCRCGRGNHGQVAVAKGLRGHVVLLRRRMIP